jgi:hypothetical protein
VTGGEAPEVKCYEALFRRSFELSLLVNASNFSGRDPVQNLFAPSVLIYWIVIR